MKNNTDTQKYLEGRNYVLTQQGNTITMLATVLLSLVVNTSPHHTGDCVPEGAANVIKAVALLMEEAVTVTYIECITEAIDRNGNINMVNLSNEVMVKALQENS